MDIKYLIEVDNLGELKEKINRTLKIVEDLENAIDEINQFKPNVLYKKSSVAEDKNSDQELKELIDLTVLSSSDSGIESKSDWDWMLASSQNSSKDVIEEFSLRNLLLNSSFKLTSFLPFNFSAASLIEFSFLDSSSKPLVSIFMWNLLSLVLVIKYLLKVIITQYIEVVNVYNTKYSIGDRNVRWIFKRTARTVRYKYL